MLKVLGVAWLGTSLAACGSTVQVNLEAVWAGEKDVEVQTALARFKDVRVVGQEDGAVYAVTGRLGQLPSGSAVGELRAQDALHEVVESLAPVFRVSGEELVLQRTHVDERGHRHLRFQQTFNGLPVVGGEVVLHADGEGHLYAMNGSVRMAAPPSTRERLSAEAAQKAAVDASRVADALSLDTPRLLYVLLEHARAPQLAWEVLVEGRRQGMPALDWVYVDAERGTVLRVDPRVHSALSRRMYTANNTTVTPGTLRRTEGQAPVGDTHLDGNYERLGGTYTCYKTLFNRDSLDNAGRPLISTVHYGVAYNNAYWDGTQMVYGDGDGVTFSPLGLDADVTTHELTHGVTESESNLTYSGESGGLNESISDIFAGVCQSFASGTWSTAPEVFEIGEAVYTPLVSGDALRYMDDPARDGDSLDYFPDYSSGVDVHYSSGISNLAFALLAKGGTHPRGKTTNVVPGIGVEKAGRIFYKANTDLFTSSTTFEQAETYTVQAAEALYGVGSAESLAVAEAWKAVGVPAVVPTSTPLTNGVAVANLSGDADSRAYYTLEVPAGQKSLVFNLGGGTGDADLYVRRGSAPTDSAYDCRPNKVGNAESCAFSSPASGTWYVMVKGFAAYSGASLKGTFVASTTGGTPVSITVSGSVASGHHVNYGPYSVVAGSQFQVVMTGTGDPDLYVRFGAPPSTFIYNCRPYLSGASETCNVTVPFGQSRAYIMVQGYTAATYDLAIDYTQP